MNLTIRTSSGKVQKINELPEANMSVTLFQTADSQPGANIFISQDQIPKFNFVICGDQLIILQESIQKFIAKIQSELPKEST